MKRKTFVMHLYPGRSEEYKKRHNAIWPDLKAELRKAGVSDYSIHWDPKTNLLFAYQILADDTTEGDLASKEIVKKWWHMMADLMETHPDESPVCDDLTELFHMD
ncbi:MAG: L-rhamnose mutarotase [Treponema sp.]|jgi:L-rhamnose mutarotase|nr:L-rhamnose mutarotase [Treponema sp.]